MVLDLVALVLTICMNCTRRSCIGVNDMYDDWQETVVKDVNDFVSVIKEMIDVNGDGKHEKY